MAEEKKNHWNFLANLLGAETKGDEQQPAEAAEIPAAEPQEEPGAMETTAPAKKKTEPIKPKPSGWNALASEFGLTAEEEAEQAARSAKLEPPADSFEASPTEPEVAEEPAKSEADWGAAAELPPQLPGFGTKAKPPKAQPERERASVPAKKAQEVTPEREVSKREPEPSPPSSVEIDAEETDEEAPRRKRRRRRGGGRRQEVDQPELSEEVSVDLGDEPEIADATTEESEDDAPKRRRRRRRRSGDRDRREDEVNPRSRRNSRDDDEADEEAPEIVAEFDDASEPPEDEGRTRRRRRRRSARGKDSRDIEARETDYATTSRSDDVEDLDRPSAEDGDDEERPRRRRRRSRQSEDQRVSRRQAADVKADFDGDADDDDEEVARQERPRRRTQQYSSWTETIGHVVDANLATRSKSNGSGGRGRGGRGRGRGDRGRR